MNDGEAQKYAWDWFALHSGQRLQLVNFWLVAISFLAGAFVQSHLGHLRAVAAGVALVGAVASLAFQRLDVRTRQLTLVAEDALREFEAAAVAQGVCERAALVTRAGAARMRPVDSYRIIIQGLQITVALAFLAAFGYELVS